MEIIGDALQTALGPRQFDLVADYLGGDERDDDRDTLWMTPDDIEAEPLGDHDHTDF